jgi:drug/metabolite transporter (DMT)-like permease
MFPALLTTCFFAATAAIARRAALLVGPTTANLYRLALAVLLLGAWAWSFGHGLGAAFGWFLASGVAGFGIGGLLMFHALPRAGSNVANLVVQCGSAVAALVTAWVWLGERLEVAELIAIAAILAGVILGTAPRSFPQLTLHQLKLGAALAALSALGQGAGTVLSRKAFATARAAGLDLDPGTATFERLLGGLLVALVAWLVIRSARLATTTETPHTDSGRAWPWVFANTLTGPVLGVTCLQWALSTTPAGIVQSIVATAPLLTAPLALGLGEALPRGRYFAGAILAVAGTIVLWWQQ